MTTNTHELIEALERLGPTLQDLYEQSCDDCGAEAGESFDATASKPTAQRCADWLTLIKARQALAIQPQAEAGWLPIETFTQETAPYGALIKAPSLVHLDFNPEGVTIGCLPSDDPEEPILGVRWNGTHDCYEECHITDATHWKPIDFRLTDPEAQKVMDAMIADRDHAYDENDKLKAQLDQPQAEAQPGVASDLGDMFSKAMMDAHREGREWLYIWETRCARRLLRAMDAGESVGSAWTAAFIELNRDAITANPNNNNPVVSFKLRDGIPPASKDVEG